MRNNPAVSVATLYSFLLVLTRVAGAFLFVPLPAFRQGPEPARIGLALCATLALFPVWPAPPEADPSSGRLVLWLLGEMAFGTAAGLAIAFLNETLLVAAQVFGLQAGYSYSSTIDPTTEADSNVLLVFAHFLAGLLFFSLNLHCHLVRAFALSLERHPPGTYLVQLSSVPGIIELGAGMFSTGLRLALPVIALLVLVDVALALLGRLQMQLQLLSLAFPAKMLGALALLAAVAALYVPIYQKTAERTFAALLRVVAGDGG